MIILSIIKDNNIWQLFVYFIYNFTAVIYKRTLIPLLQQYRSKHLPGILCLVRNNDFQYAVLLNIIRWAVFFLFPNNLHYFLWNTPFSSGDVAHRYID